jgi:hypothetical protein
MRPVSFELLTSFADLSKLSGEFRLAFRPSGARRDQTLLTMLITSARGQVGKLAMTNLNGAYTDNDHIPHGAFRQIGDADSNQRIPSCSRSLMTWERGAPPESKAGKQANYFIGPNGNVVTIADLPLAKTTRWVIRRKAEIVLAVHAGLLTLEEACRRYRLTAQEFFSWQSAIERHGLLALRTTQLQQYRHGVGEPGLAKGRTASRPSAADRFAFTDDDVA